jgi:soluble lytic murein transglycosylase
MRIPAGGYAVGLAVALFWAMPSAEAFAESIYQFVDQDGVTHFSNVPTDSRYARIGSRSARPQAIPQAHLTNLTRPLRETLVSNLGKKSAQEAIYQFVDRDGGIHYSNAPTNPRYKTFREGKPFGRFRPTLPSLRLHETILQASLLHRLNPALVHAVIRAESAYDPQALSAKGAMGLMQLMPETASLLNVSNPYDPEQNISGGVRYLRYLLDRFGGNLELALAAYNAGENRVSRENRVPHISETQQYVRKVLRFYQDIDTAPLVTRRFVNYLSPN